MVGRGRENQRAGNPSSKQQVLSGVAGAAEIQAAAARQQAVYSDTVFFSTFGLLRSLFFLGSSRPTTQPKKL